MNKEVMKAMNKKENKVDDFRKWWNKNGYKVMRVILFPIWGYVTAKERLHAYLNSKQEWSEERANEILSYYIPRKSEWDAEDLSFYFADNGMGWSIKHNQKKIKMKDRRWWRMYTNGWGGKVRTHLIENFELEGFEKIVGDTYDSWTEITFKMKEGCGYINGKKDNQVVTGERQAEMDKNIPKF